MKILSRLLALVASAFLVACGGGGGGGEVILVPPVVIVPEQPMLRMAPQNAGQVHEVLAGSKAVPVYAFSVTESAPQPVFNIALRSVAAPIPVVVNTNQEVRLLRNGADFTTSTGVRAGVLVENDQIMLIFPDGWQPQRTGDTYTLVADVSSEAADRTPVVDFRLAIVSYAERAGGFLVDGRAHMGKTLRIVGKTGYSLPAVLSTTPAQQMPQFGTRTVTYEAFFACPVGNARQCNQKHVMVDVFGGTAPEFIFSGNVFPMTLVPGTTNSYEALVDIAAAQSQNGYPISVRTSVLPGFQAVTVYLKTVSTNIGTPEDLNPRMPNPCYTFASNCKG